MIRVNEHYALVCRKVWSGDVLLFHGRGPAACLIGMAGRGGPTHTGLAVWSHEVLLCAEMVWSGGRAVCLSHLVRRYPGAIHVYRLAGCSETNLRYAERFEACAAMLGFTGLPYGYADFCRVAALHVPILRRFVRAERSGANGERPHRAFCSQAVSAAYRKAGIDLRPDLVDRLTEPRHLVDSEMLEYQFTLVP